MYLYEVAQTILGVKFLPCPPSKHGRRTMTRSSPGTQAAVGLYLFPLTIFGTLASHRGEGLGYRAISDRLAAQGVITSKSRERCHKFVGAYSPDSKVLRNLLHAKKC